MSNEDKPTNENRAWLAMDSNQVQASYELGEKYIGFLNRVKTEREAIQYAIETAKNHGFTEYRQQEVFPGQKFYLAHKNKSCAFVIVGQKPWEDGINWVVSHVDSPRLDLKPQPLYEADGLALLKTHYYGGIRKHQWLAIPLALHGVVAVKGGQIITVAIGTDPDDPVFTIADLLPHLAQEQVEKKLKDAFKGEGLNVLAASRPVEESAVSKPVRQQVLNILKDKYGIENEDFVSAELQLVPAMPARNVGFDHSMIGGYGHDDRVCAFASLEAIMALEKPERTSICLLADKEEVGSMGNTGLNSLLMENLLAELMACDQRSDYFAVRRALARSYALSADVNSAIDPNYPDVFEKMNNSYLSGGVVLTKYTGSRGKSNSNDANPEFIGIIRNLFENHGVTWQVGELGKVDLGGGGTVAQYLSYYGMEVIDCGVPVLGMHSPFEVISKADLYMAYKAYLAFYQLTKYN